MVPIPEHQTLALVEAGGALTPLDRAVRLLAVLEGITVDEASDWPLDERDAALIAGRRAMFGTALPFVAQCISCGEAMESALDCDTLLHLAGEPDADLAAPTSRDVAEAARSGDPALLAARCAPGLTIPPGEIEARMERAFPLLDLRVVIDCEACGERIAQRFDVARYFWGELERRAAQMLDDVHMLARAYGWSEAEVLALSPARRRAYIDRVTA